MLDPDKKLPDGWKVIIPDSDKYKHLCPDCAKKFVLESLYNLRKLCDAFNLMGGSLYSEICADEMNKIIQILNETFDIGVNSSLVGISRTMVQSMKIMVVDSMPVLLVLSLLIIVKREFQKM